MRACILVVLCAVLSLGVLGRLSPAGESLPEPKSVCAYCGVPVPGGVHKPGCPYYEGAKKHVVKHAPPRSQGMQSVIVGSIFSGLLSGMLGSDDDAQDAAAQRAAVLAAQQQADELARRTAEQQAREAVAQARYEKMMQSYKRLDGQAKATDPNAGLGLKTLNGDMEKLAAGARQPFDNPGPNLKILGSAPPAPAEPTHFFGDSMSDVDIQGLVNPDSDPRVVDLREAGKYLEQTRKKEPKEPKKPEESKTQLPAPVIIPDRREEALGEPILPKAPDCAELRARLAGFLEQRERFQKTVQLAREQLDAWKEANRNALLNAAKDGFEYFAGQYLDALTKRGEAAGRLRGVLERNADSMAREGVDVAAVRAKIDRLARVSNLGQVAELTNQLNDWTTFAKDGLSAMLGRLAESDAEVKAMLADPKVGKYFETDSPGWSAAFDLSKLLADGKVFGKWVARKVPLIAGVEISLKQGYNGLDWLLSRNRIMEANQVNGKVLDAARSLQQYIDDTYYELKTCR